MKWNRAIILDSRELRPEWGESPLIPLLRKGENGVMGGQSGEPGRSMGSGNQPLTLWGWQVKFVGHGPGQEGAEKGFE